MLPTSGILAALSSSRPQQPRIRTSSSSIFPSSMETIERLKKLIRDVPDFPKPGILFKDFTPLIRDPAGLALAVELMVNPFRDKGVNLVVGAESRGFIFGMAMAQALSA